MRSAYLFIILAITGLVLAGCNGTQTPPTTQPVTETAVPVDTTPEATETQVDTGYPIAATPLTLPGYPYPAPEDDGPTAVIPDPYPAPGQGTAECEIDPAPVQPIEIPTSDDLVLAGDFYPPGVCDAPIVVLMHQAGDSKESWGELAAWLQNRPGETPALAYDWFPQMPVSLSFAVLAVDFRGHGASPGEYTPDGIRADAQNAVDFAGSLPGIDPNRVITIGASIGADGAVDGCVTLDGTEVAENQAGRGCIGALSLSPGSYLGVSYLAAAGALGEAPHSAIVHCIAAEADGGSPDLCRADFGDFQSETIYPGSDHGIRLLEPGRDPNIGDVILAFLLESLRLN